MANQRRLATMHGTSWIKIDQLTKWDKWLTELEHTLLDSRSPYIEVGDGDSFGHLIEKRIQREGREENDGLKRARINLRSWMSLVSTYMPYHFGFQCGSWQCKKYDRKMIVVSEAGYSIPRAVAKVGDANGDRSKRLHEVTERLRNLNHFPRERRRETSDDPIIVHHI